MEINQSYAKFSSGRASSLELLPDPEPRARLFPLFSADDHLVEPPSMFEGRLPERFASRVPRVVEMNDEVRSQLWDVDGELQPNVGFNAVAGRRRDQMGEPMRFDEMRRGAWDVHERVRDMDLDGVDVSVCFPSALAGFAGQRFSQHRDQEYGYALFRAWNDWHIEDWAGQYPDRFVPVQLAWLCDPKLAAKNVYENAARGFKALTFPENPQPLGFPSLHDEYWNPLFRACEETDTVVCLHLGSSSTLLSASPDCTEDEVIMLFPVQAQVTALEWVFSKIPLRFPSIKIVNTEGGISWVPLVVDRLAHYERNYRPYLPSWSSTSESPSELFRRNFWFCALNESTVVPIIDSIGIDKVLLETDYPHSDSTWPDTHAAIARDFGSLSKGSLDKITYKNAAALFRVEVGAMASASSTV